MTFFVYKATNTKNNKIYIGKTCDPARRWSAHKSESNNDNNEHYTYFNHAIKKYGFDVFTFEIIDQFDDESIAYENEVKWINYYKSNNRDIGYNLTIGGKGVITNRPVSLETRKKISEAQKGIKRRDNYDVSDESRKKMSEASLNNKGLISNEIKKEILDFFNSGNYTKKQLSDKFNIKIESIRYIITYHNNNGFKTEEQKHTNRSNAKKGKKLSEEHRKKISEANMGRIFSEESKEKISKALSGKIISQEVRDKIAITVSGKKDYLEIKKQIIDLFETGKYRRTDLARKFNLHYASIKKIIDQYIKDKK